MRNLNPIFNDHEFNRRRHPSAFRIAVAHFTVLLSIVGLLALVFGTVFFGLGAFEKQMKINDCVDFKNYEAQYPNSISEEIINKCGKISIEIK